MKQKIAFLFPIVFFSLFSIGQSLNGSWVGRAEVKGSSTFNTYLCEISLKKNSKGYSGNLSYFFGSSMYNVPVSGKYWPATRTIELNPFPLITYFAKDPNFPDCIMDGSLTLYVYEKDSSLFGQLNPIEKYRNSCPLVTIYLAREKETPGMLEAIENRVENVKSSTQAEKEVKELNKEPNNFFSAPTPHAKSGPGLQNAVKELEKRNFTDGPLIEVEGDSVLLHLYDNGKVDGDSVSVFFNRYPVITNQVLGTKPVVVNLQILPGVNEIAMFAISLGEVPPNTALCIIYAGDKRYDLNLSSSFASNATVRIKRKTQEK